MKFFYIFVFLFTAYGNAFAVLKDKAVLVFLDKLTAQTVEAEVSVGKTARFENIYVRVERCDKSAPHEVPESAAYITIKNKNDNDYILFQGWVFASNPSVNILEDPVYDVWLKECK